MGSIASALTGSGSKKAASAQAGAAAEAIETQRVSLAEQLKLGRESLALQKDMFEQSLALGAPYRASGNVALAQYESLIYGIPVNKTASYQAYSAQSATGPNAEDRAALVEQYRPQFTSTSKTSGGTPLYRYKDGRIGTTEIPDPLVGESDGLRGTLLQGGTQETSNTDMNALNAHVDKIMAEKQAGVLSARDEAFGGMDVNAIAPWQKSEGYEFRLDEGQKALERSAAARSGVLSGAQVKATERFGQDYASNEFGTYMDRLGGLINTGSANAGAAANLTANSANSQSGVLNNMINSNSNSAMNIGALQTQIGAARASGYLGQQAAGTNLLNQAFGLAGTIYGGGVTGGSGFTNAGWNNFLATH